MSVEFMLKLARKDVEAKSSWLVVDRKKSNQSKENRLSNTEFNALQKSEAALNGKIIYEENPSNLISIKSYQPEGRISSMD